MSLKSCRIELPPLHASHKFISGQREFHEEVKMSDNQMKGKIYYVCSTMGHMLIKWSRRTRSKQGGKTLPHWTRTNNYAMDRARTPRLPKQGALPKEKDVGKQFLT